MKGYSPPTYLAKGQEEMKKFIKAIDGLIAHYSSIQGNVKGLAASEGHASGHQQVSYPIMCDIARVDCSDCPWVVCEGLDEYDCPCADGGRVHSQYTRDRIARLNRWKEQILTENLKAPRKRKIIKQERNY